MAFQPKTIIAPFLTDGQNTGTFTVSNATYFIVGAVAYLNGAGLPTLEVQIRDIGIDNQTITVGVNVKPNFPVYNNVDISAYTVLKNSTITQPPQAVFPIGIPSSVAAGGGGGSGGTVNQGSPATPGQSWYVQLSNGTNSPAILNSSPVGTEYGLAVRIVGSTAGGTSSIFNTAFPSSGTAAGALVVSGAPSFTAGNMSALTIDTSGNLRVGGTISAVQSGTWNVNANVTNSSIPVTQSGVWNISSILNPVTVTLGNGVNVSGTINAVNQTVTLPVDGSQGIAIDISGSWVGVLYFQASPDGVNWAQIEVWNADSTSGEFVQSSTTSNGIFQPLNVAGWTSVRVLAAAWTSGTATVYINGNNSPANIITYARENGAPTPSYGVQIAGTDGSLTRFLRATGTSSPPLGRLVTASQGTNGTAAGNMLPSLVAGWGTDNNMYGIKVDTSGQIILSPSSSSSSGGSATGGTAASSSTLAGAIYNATPPSLTTGQQVGLQADSQGDLLVNTAVPSGANVTGVARTNVSSTVVAANGNRNGIVIFNNANSNLFIKLGTGCGTTQGTYSFYVQPFGLYEVFGNFGYQGAISAVWASAGAGHAEFTELSI